MGVNYHRFLSIVADMRAVLKDLRVTHAIMRKVVYFKAVIWKRSEKVSDTNLKEYVSKSKVFENRQFLRERESLHPYSRERSPLSRKKKTSRGTCQEPYHRTQTTQGQN